MLLLHNSMQYTVSAWNTDYKPLEKVARSDWIPNKLKQMFPQSFSIFATLVWCTNMGRDVFCLYAKIKNLAKSRDKRHCWCSLPRFSKPILQFKTLETDDLFKFNVIVDGKIQRIKPTPKKYKMAIWWRRFINDETWSNYGTALLLQSFKLRSDFILYSKF